MVTPSAVKQPCPFRNLDPETGVYLYTDVVNQTWEAATPHPTPLTTVTIRRDFEDWKQTLPAPQPPVTVVQKRSVCTMPGAVCSYHGRLVTGTTLQTQKTVTRVVTYDPMLASTPPVPATPGGPMTDETTVSGNQTTRHQVYENGYAITTITTIILFDGKIANDGLKIQGPTTTTRDSQGNTTTITETTEYKLIKQLVDVYPCLRFEFDDVNSDIVIDTHGLEFNQRGHDLGWKEKEL